MKKDIRNIIYPILAIGVNICFWGSWPLKTFSPLVPIIFSSISLILVAIINTMSGKNPYRQDAKNFVFNSLSGFITVKICGALMIIWMVLFAVGAVLGFA